MKSTPIAANGSATSSTQDTLRPAMLTSAASKTLPQTTCAATPNAITSLASASGATPCVLPDGRMIDPFGLVAALASLSHKQVKALGLQTSGISGLRGSISSASAALQSSLESRLKQRLPTAGSTLFKMTWKQKATPSLRSVCLLRASALRISDSESGSWPTPTKTQAGGTPENFNERKRRHRSQVWQAPWSTPTAQDHSRGTKPPRPQDTGVPLSQQVSGLTPNGSCAETVKLGQLNPEFSLWLMGIPAAWASCAPVATRSTRSAPRNSSAPTSANTLTAQPSAAAELE